MMHGTVGDVLRANAILQAKAVIGQIMQAVVGDELKLAEVLAAGRLTWRNNFATATRGLPVDDGIADRIWLYFEGQWRVKAREHHLTPKQWLDKVEVVEHRPPTEKEIEDAWEHDVFSREDARIKFYN
jgi:hypothetical protein